eukprot:4135018-Pyramimonas_sp.AAC.1
MEHWRSFLKPDASRDAVVEEENGDVVISIDRAERASRPMPVFFHSCMSRTFLFCPHHRTHVCALRVWDGAMPRALAARYFLRNHQGVHVWIRDY